VETGARFVFQGRCYTIVKTDAQDLFWAQHTESSGDSLYRFLMWTHKPWQFLVIRTRYDRDVEV
jgi:hypothetical protein